MFAYGTGCTAALTALAWENRRARRELPPKIGSGLLRMLNLSGRVRGNPTLPAGLMRREVTGLVAGPWLYLRGRRHLGLGECAAGEEDCEVSKFHWNPYDNCLRKRHTLREPRTRVISSRPRKLGQRATPPVLTPTEQLNAILNSRAWRWVCRYGRFKNRYLVPAYEFFVGFFGTRRAEVQQSEKR